MLGTTLYLPSNPIANLSVIGGVDCQSLLDALFSMSRLWSDFAIPLCTACRSSAQWGRYGEFSHAANPGPARTSRLAHFEHRSLRSTCAICRDQFRRWQSSEISIGWMMATRWQDRHSTRSM